MLTLALLAVGAFPAVLLVARIAAKVVAAVWG
jgi:hypothetical protein